jgi:hypothetical protein
MSSGATIENPTDTNRSSVRSAPQAARYRGAWGGRGSGKSHFRRTLPRCMAAWTSWKEGSRQSDPRQRDRTKKGCRPDLHLISPQKRRQLGDVACDTARIGQSPLNYLIMGVLSMTPRRIISGAGRRRFIGSAPRLAETLPVIAPGFPSRRNAQKALSGAQPRQAAGRFFTPRRAFICAANRLA